jgi:hypothetical protein
VSDFIGVSLTAIPVAARPTVAPANGVTDDGVRRVVTNYSTLAFGVVVTFSD